MLGGRLSEGINFNDDLCRLMFIIGLPYPNNQNYQIKERIKYWDNKGIKTFTGNDYYNNLCLKIINQAIGRSIRHLNDWAYLMLVDFRFKSLKQ